MFNSQIHIDIAAQRAEALRHEIHPLRLHGKHEVTIRPVQATDHQVISDVFAGLGPESRLRRFFVPKKRLSRAEIRYLTDIDHHDHEALAAISRDGRGLGVARYVRLRTRPGSAEVAVAVVDDWHGRGLGSSLLTMLAGRARAEGVSRFTASVSSTNSAVPRLLKTVNAEVIDRTRHGAVLEYEIVIPEPDSQRSRCAAGCAD
jgi:acetyltransferase